MNFIFYNLILAISCKPLFNADCGSICPRILSPVCGSDGVTYDNKCEFQRARCASKAAEKVLFVKNGACDLKISGIRSVLPKTSVPECPLFCHRMLRPVCGSDNQTYSNKCVLKRESCKQPWLNLEVKHTGSCDSPKNTFADFLPRKKFLGLKKSGMECPSFCSRIYQPVCGTDNKTYGNECVLKRRACNEPSLNLKIKNSRACESPISNESDCPLFCHRMLQPICGSDNQTYSNECTLKRNACNNPSLNLYAQYSGVCESKKDYEMISEESLKPEEVFLKIAKSDCPRFCNRMRRPVCGSNNQTYGNVCVLKMQICNNPSLNLYELHAGEC